MIGFRLTPLERAITGYHQDDVGDWVAELDCGHQQHVRHRPPMQWREWVLEPEGRAAHLGTPLACKWCDEEGGDAACFACLVCPECGGVSGDGTGHRPGCPASPHV